MKSFLQPLLVVPLLLAGCSIPELERGDPKITMASPPPPAPAPRPLTLAEARRAGVLQLRLSPFHEYDSKITGAIQKRWEHLLKTIPRQPAAGKVVLNFKLIYDGSVSDLQVAETDLAGVAVEICKQAVLDSAPHEPWPRDMRALIAEKTRDVTFTFQYQDRPK